jgi:hypothetical protein
MKKFALAAALFFATALPVFAQSETGGSAYRIDNFDLPGLVRVQLPAALPSPKKLRRGRTQPTVTNLDHTAARTIPTVPTVTNLSASLSGFTTGDTTVDGYILESAKRNLVDPLLLYSIMHQESTFKPRAMSNKGARGLMQLMPGTAARFGVTSIWDPKQNIEGGTRYMRFLLDKFEGDVKLALAGYNAGEGAVVKYGYRIPPYSETQEYVRRISRRYDLIRDPMAYRYANSYTREQVAANQQKESAPLSIYERSVFAVKLPDGRLQLVTQ